MEHKPENPPCGEDSCTVCNTRMKSKSTEEWARDVIGRFETELEYEVTKAYGQLVFEAGDMDKFYAILTNALTTHTNDKLREVLGKVERMIEKHDPNVKMGRETNENYWGNTLREDLSLLQAEITDDV